MNEFVWDFNFFFPHCTWCFACGASFEVTDIMHKDLLCPVDVIKCHRTVLNNVLTEVMFEIIDTTTACVDVEFPGLFGQLILFVSVSIKIALLCHEVIEIIIGFRDVFSLLRHMIIKIKIGFRVVAICFVIYGCVI